MAEILQYPFSRSYLGAVEILLLLLQRGFSLHPGNAHLTPQRLIGESSQLTRPVAQVDDKKPENQLSVLVTRNESFESMMLLFFRRLPGLG